ncbi:MAG: c-type cytochrome, partial [Planctomycetaceae bacterium]|nr:c-type cytochrome [Planctomycetaceae bacterium]
HRIDRFRLQPKGASFTSLAEPLITGGENFRPVGLATAPDGSLFCTDWVLRDYKLHGHGRIWRISTTKSRNATIADIGALRDAEFESVKRALASRSQKVVRMGATLLRRSEQGRRFLTAVLANDNLIDRPRLEALWSLALIPKDQRPTEFWDFELTGPIPEAFLALAADDWSDWGPPQDRLNNSNSPLGENWHQDAEVIHKNASMAFLMAEFSRSSTEHENDRRDSMGLAYQIEFAKALLLEHDPYLTHAAIRLLGAGIGPLNEIPDVLKMIREHQPKPGDEGKRLRSAEAISELRLALTLMVRRNDLRQRQTLLAALEDPDVRIRRVGVQWAAEEGYRELKPLVATAFDLPALNTELFLATIAALEMLDGKKPEDFDKTPAEQYVVPLLKDEKRSPAVRAQALRLVSPTDKSLDAPLFASLLKSDNEPLRLETVRTLQGANPEVAGPLLREIVADASRISEQTRDASATLRAEAIVGLAAVAKSEPVGGPTRKLLRTFLKNSIDRSLRLEALRAARPLIAEDAELRDGVLEIANSLILLADGRVANELSDQVALAFADAKLDLPKSAKLMTTPKPKDRTEWLAQLNGSRDADPAAGRRVFFNPNGAGCFKCHIVDGRGGRVGPDLSRAVGTMNRDRLIQSILEPSREIAPQFVSWTFELHSGKVLTGMIVHENEGKTIVGDAEGKLTEIKTIDIVARVPQKTSVMPDKLAERMTLQELRDLIAFLDAQR